MFGPCRNVGHCNRKVCPYQHVGETEDDDVIRNLREKIGVSEKSKKYGLKSRTKERQSTFVNQTKYEAAQKKKTGKQEVVMATGLRNVGNSCYVNATLQALSSITPFTERVLERKEERKTS